MKIAFIIPELTGKGGVEKVTQLLSDVLSTRGLDVTVISLFKNNEQCYFLLNDKVNTVFITEEVYDNNKISKFAKINLLIKGRKRLKSYLQQNKFDLLISQTALPAFFLLSLGYGKKTIVCEHYKYELYSGLVTKIRNYVYSKLLKVITLTEADASKYKAKGIFVEAIPNMSSFPIQNNTGSNSKRIISIGRLSYQKGYDLLIKAYKKVKVKHPDWKLDIYGEGELKQELNDLCKEIQLSDVINFKGATKDVQRELCNSELYVMSSRFEGFPMVLLEAMSCNVPIVSFSCPEGPSELLKNNAGYLVPAQNIELLGDALNYMIENEEIRTEMVTNASEEIKKYTPDAIADKWFKLFKNLNLPE